MKAGTDSFWSLNLARHLTCLHHYPCARFFRRAPASALHITLLGPTELRSETGRRQKKKITRQASRAVRKKKKWEEYCLCRTSLRLPLPPVCRLSCLSALCPVLHGSEGSAWARNLGVPLPVVGRGHDIILVVVHQRHLCSVRVCGCVCVRACV